MKLFEIDYSPILCTKYSNQVGKFYLAEYSNKVLIEAATREEAIERFYQGNNALINSVVVYGS